MATWQTVYEVDGKLPDGRDKCIRVWTRQWCAGVGEGFITRQGEILEAEGARAQFLYDECLREFMESAL